MIKRHFTEHPSSVDETYVAHFFAAGSFSIRMFIASLACLVHAVLPFLFVKTGSEAIESLYDCMAAKRRRFEEGRLETRDAARAAQ